MFAAMDARRIAIYSKKLSHQTHNFDCLQITGAYKSGNNNTDYNRSGARHKLHSGAQHSVLSA